jgi:hypothetical protein
MTVYEVRKFAGFQRVAAEIPDDIGREPIEAAFSATLCAMAREQGGEPFGDVTFRWEKIPDWQLGEHLLGNAFTRFWRRLFRKPVTATVWQPGDWNVYAHVRCRVSS